MPLPLAYVAFSGLCLSEARSASTQRSLGMACAGHRIRRFNEMEHGACACNLRHWLSLGSVTSLLSQPQSVTQKGVHTDLLTARSANTGLCSTSAISGCTLPASITRTPLCATLALSHLLNFNERIPQKGRFTYNLVARALTESILLTEIEVVPSALCRVCLVRGETTINKMDLHLLHSLNFLFFLLVFWARSLSPKEQKACCELNLRPKLRDFQWLRVVHVIVKRESTGRSTRGLNLDSAVGRCFKPNAPRIWVCPRQPAEGVQVSSSSLAKGCFCPRVFAARSST